MLSAMIFCLDTLIPIKLSAAALYAVPVAIAASLVDRRRLLWVGGVCMALTIVGYGIMHGSKVHGGPFIGALISLSAIGLTTLLGLQIQASASQLVRQPAVADPTPVVNGLVSARDPDVEDKLDAARAELSQAMRRTTMGELARAMAHEVNQPLAAVVTDGEAGLRWLQRDPSDLEEVRQSLERIIASGRRASDTIAGLRTLASKDRMSLSRLTLNDVVNDILPLVDRELTRHGIDLTVYLDPTPPVITGDRVQLQQVVINLLMNAVQALSDIDHRSRRIVMRTGNEADAAGMASVRLEVTDNGDGLAADARERLFTPFYTTKPDGMGIGLCICRSIVEVHGGQITGRPGTARGAVFAVRLPAHDAAAS